MKKKVFLTVMTLLLTLVLMVPAAMAGFVIGSPADADTGNYFPFGGSYSHEYQQVYTSSQFSGPVTITSLAFYNTAYDSGATAVNPGIWTISLSTTAADWNTLSSTFAANIGGDNTQVFSGNLAQPWAFGKTLIINLSTPFTYDPANGNLLMDVMASTISSGNEIFFDTNGFNSGGFNGNTIMGRVYNYGDVNAGYGLVTGFNASAVPVPAALWLLGSGLLGLVGLRRKFSK